MNVARCMGIFFAIIPDKLSQIDIMMWWKLFLCSILDERAFLVFSNRVPFQAWDMVAIRPIWSWTFITFLALGFSTLSEALKYNLSSQEWTLCSSQSGKKIMQTINDILLSNLYLQGCIKGQVPGGIYTSLQRAGKIQDPLVSGNDVSYRKFGQQDWTYTTTLKGNSNNQRVFEFLIQIIYSW